jgi:hypothetical protein
MKKILSFSGFEALNERILIPPDEDRRLKDEILPKIKVMLEDNSLWTTEPELEEDVKSNSIPKNSIPFKYKMASGEEAVVHFFVLFTISWRFRALFLSMDKKDLKDNLIGINSDLSLTLNSTEGEKALLSDLKHELIHAKDPGLNQYQYSNFDRPRNKEAYRKNYFKTKPEGIAYGGQFLEEIKDRVEEFVQGGLTEEKVQTLNSVLNDLANGYIEPSDLSPETIEFLDYSKDIENSIWIGKSNSIRALKLLRDSQNLEFRKFQKKFYQEIVRIAAEINSDLSTKYPQIKGRIKVSASQP